MKERKEGRNQKKKQINTCTQNTSSTSSVTHIFTSMLYSVIEQQNNNVDD